MRGKKIDKSPPPPSHSPPSSPIALIHPPFPSGVEVVGGSGAADGQGDAMGSGQRVRKPRWGGRRKRKARQKALGVKEDQPPPSPPSTPIPLIQPPFPSGVEVGGESGATDREGDALGSGRRVRKPRWGGRRKRKARQEALGVKESGLSKVARWSIVSLLGLY